VPVAALTHEPGRENVMKTAKRGATRAMLAGGLLLAAAASAVAGDQERRGTPNQGLQLAIAPVRETWTVAEDPEFKVSFRNNGTDDLVLNLGLRQGGDWFPVSVSLVLSDSKGPRIEFKLHGPAYSTGRIDDYPVALQKRAIHVLAFNLSEFYRPKLLTGRHLVSARFQGRGAEHKNLGLDLTPWNFWQGTLESDVAEFEIRDPK